MRSVLVTVDAVRPDHLGQYGYDRDTMPVLDRIDEGGTRFAAAFANGPHSGVSIPSFLTSRYRGRDALENGPNLATALADAGVSTAGIHSNTMLATAIGGAAGFDTFADFDVGTDERDHERVERSTLERVRDSLADVAGPVIGDWGPAQRLYERLSPAGGDLSVQAYADAATVTDRAIEWIVEHDGGDDECFLWVHYMDPHRPYGVDPADPAYADEPVDDREIRELMVKAGTDPAAVTDAERRLLIDRYDSDLRYTSDHLDRLLDAVDDRWGFDETLIAVTADHGEEFGDHGRYFHRNEPYDELLAVPLFVRHPENDEDRVRNQRELLDIAPTVCAFHDAPIPDAFAGRSLFDDAERRVVASGALDVDAPVAAVRTGSWKYIAVGDVDRELDPLERDPTDVGRELYNLTDDPDELTDVSDENPDIADDLKGAIPADLLTGGSTAPDRANGASGATRERLERLGYLE